MNEKRSDGRTKAGLELTEEMLDRMATEAENGLDTAKLQPRSGRTSKGVGSADAVPVSLDPELRRALNQRAHAEGRTASEVVGDALRHYLDLG
jgi:hypothetical protein